MGVVMLLLPALFSFVVIIFLIIIALLIIVNLDGTRHDSGSALLRVVPPWDAGTATSRKGTLRT